MNRRRSWRFAVVLACCSLFVVACDEPEPSSPLHLHIGFEPLAAHVASGIVPAGSYLFDVDDVDEQRQVATMEIELGGEPANIYNYLDDPVPHIALRPGVLILKLDTIEPPQRRRFRTLELGTLFVLGTSAEKPLTVEFLDALGGLLGEPLFYETVPNNSAHPDDITPLRIALPAELGETVTIRLSTVLETFLPIVFIGLSVP